MTNDLLPDEVALSALEEIEKLVIKKIGGTAWPSVFATIRAAITSKPQPAAPTQIDAGELEENDVWRGFPDNRPDNTGLDDGPPLPLSHIMAWKKPLVIKACQAGLSARACAKVFDISHETAADWVRGCNDLSKLSGGE